uniref:Negative regulator of genetic competence ClpC/MecB n=1 Tax=uncultured bacterium Contigcl_1565 TaxID=1393654 RepID=W0FM33_9BACT|nr:negative regulator of genetic competence ClpC/MecB [uncultured bacterium Contigcl_1565]
MIDMFSKDSARVLATAAALNNETRKPLNDVLLFAALCMAETPAREFLAENVYDINGLILKLGVNTYVTVPDESIPSLIDEANDRLTADAKRILTLAETPAKQTNCKFVEPVHILYVLLNYRFTARAVIQHALDAMDVNPRILRERLTRLIRSASERPDDDDDDERSGVYERPDIEDEEPERRGRRSSGGKKKVLDQFGKNLTELAKQGKIDPVVGREEEINRVMQILIRRTKNNPCLVGDPGVGKTAIAEGLALKIANDDVPDVLKGKTMYSVDMGSIVAGSKFRGEFEERMKKLLEEAVSDPDTILFIDEIHSLIGAGDSDGTLDAANIMKPLLTKNELQIIGATTLDEYSKHIEKDSALERRFQKVMVNEPSEEEAIEILKGLRSKYEEHHKIRIPDDVISQAVKLSTRYVSDRYLPDKAIDLIDEAAASKRINFVDEKARREFKTKIDDLEKRKQEAVETQDFETAADIKNEEEKFKAELDKVEEKFKPDNEGFTGSLTVDDIADVLAKWTGIPVARISESDAEKLKNLESELGKRVIGQEEAVKSIARAIRRGRLGIKDESRPAGTFIFLGTTGVGKTELAKALAEVMFGDENSLVRIDMSEYMEKHDVSKLIGAPPGYVGYDEGGQLTEAVRRHPYSVVLFDEIEKAHPEVFNAMLQVLDDGRMTDGKGRTVDFKNTIIIMTSNIGARLLTGDAGRKIGFDMADDSDKDEMSRERLYGGKSYDDAKKVVLEELRKTFTPEFVNRVDEIIFFRMLDRKALMTIVDNMVGKLAKRIEGLGMKIEVTEAAKDLIAARGYDPQYGARPLRRVITSMVEDKFSEAMLDGIAKEGHIVIIDSDELPEGQAQDASDDEDDLKTIVIRDGGPIGEDTEPVEAVLPQEEAQKG